MDGHDQYGVLQKRLALSLQKISTELEGQSTLTSLVQPDLRKQLLAAVATTLPATMPGARAALSDLVSALLEAEKLSELLAMLPKDDALRPLTLDSMARAGEALRRLTATAQLPPDQAVTDEVSTDRELTAFAIKFEDDAARQRRGARLCAAGATLALLGAVAAAYWTTTLVTEDFSNRVFILISPVVLCIAFVVVALALLHAMNTRGKAAREYVRLQRGFQGLGYWMRPLPRDARHLLRITMTQSMFPRLLDDDDLVRQAKWPTDSAILQSIYGVSSEDLARIYAADATQSDDSPA